MTEYKLRLEYFLTFLLAFYTLHVFAIEGTPVTIVPVAKTPLFSDVIWQAIIAGVVTLVLAWLNKRTTDSVNNIAKEVVTAKHETGVKLKSMAKTGDDTHALVNSNMGIQLQMHAYTTKRLALITKLPDDEEAAVKAEAIYQDHVRKQAIVDARLIVGEKK